MNLIKIVAAALVAGAVAGAAAPLRAEPPQRGGVLTSIESRWAPSWAPHIIGGYEYGNLYGAVADSLIYYDFEQGLVPWLAQSWEANADSSRFTFRLRPGVTFSDGTPVDAGTVKANFDDLGLGDKDRGILPSAYFRGYAETRVIDDLTVEVAFAETNARFINVVATHLAAILSPATLARPAEERSRLENLIGSGAFVVEAVTPQQDVTLRRREGYAWAPASASNQGEAWLDKVVVRFVPDAAVRSNALLAGQAHLVRSILSGDEPRLKAAGNEIRSVSGSKTLFPWTLHFRPANPVLQDAKVRQALAIGFDRRTIAEALLSDSYVVADSILGHDHPAFVDLSAELAYDPARAATLLDEAGWLPNSKGVREKDGEELRLILAANTQNAFSKEYTDAITQQLAGLGVVIDNRAGDNAYASQVLNPKGNSDAALIPVQGWIQNGFQGNLDSGRYSGVADPAFAELVRRERVTSDPAQRLDLLQQQQRYFVTEQWLAVPLLDEAQVYGIAPNLRGLTFDAEIAPNLQSVWLAKP